MLNLEQCTVSEPVKRMLDTMFVPVSYTHLDVYKRQDNNNMDMLKKQYIFAFIHRFFNRMIITEKESDCKCFFVQT